MLSEEPLAPFAIDPHPAVAPQGLELASAPRRVDARGWSRDDCTTYRKPGCASCEIDSVPSMVVYNDRALAPPLPYG